MLIPGVELTSWLEGVYLKLITCGRSIGDVPLQTLQLLQLPRLQLSAAVAVTCAFRKTIAPRRPVPVWRLPNQFGGAGCLRSENERRRGGEGLWTGFQE